jgi:ABC-2 type transport system permease protein
MNLIFLIAQREYWTRVRKKSFLITTVLIPVLMFGAIGLFTYIASKSEEKNHIVIVDESGFFKGKIDSSNATFHISYATQAQKETNEQFLERTKGDILMHIYPKTAINTTDSVVMFKDGGVSLNAQDFINEELNRINRIQLMEEAGINKIQIDSINQSDVHIKSYDLKNNKETHSEVAMSIGYFMGILIYFVILVYGTGVMRGVMEEKTNRIAEVIISSVKPFQLMMGKILGIAMVGLTQFSIWFILMIGLNMVAALFMVDTNSLAAAGDLQQQLQNHPSEFANFMNIVKEQNWLLIGACFIIYFLGGYFVYAALFAAVGSLVNEDPQEAQQMTIPVTMPIIFAFIIMGASIKDPNSSLSIFGSLFPLTSPIVMMARIPYGVPSWQIILSMLLLFGGFVGTTWISAKIYRTGILMYGKKPSWKEVFKWMRRS